MNKKVNLIFLFIAIICNYIISQQDTSKIKPDKFFELGFASDYINLYNPRHSVVLYKGLAYSLDYSLQFEKQTKRESIYFNYGKGNLTSENELNNTRVFNVEVGYSLERRVKKISETINWYLGGDISAFLNMRTNISLGNNQVFYDFVQNLGISSSIRKELLWKERTYYLDYRLKLPFISIISRPPITFFVKDSEREDIMITSDQITKIMFTNGNVTFAGKYCIVKSNITIWRPFRRNMNRVGLSYVWDLYTYRDYYHQKQVMATHSIKFTLLTNI
ncbi:MAG: hypothetical protein JXB49_03260 [Bacteroidales bacterium]|nr:hypothetical protein [Bacteroidales bacterium]